MLGQVDWLRSAGFVDVGAAIAKEPRLPLMSLDNLESKLQFIIKDMGRTVEEVERWPQVLNYTRDHLSKRHAFLARHGCADKHSLGRMYRTSLFSLCTRLAGQPLQHLEPERSREVPSSAAEKWIQQNAAQVAASQARGEALEQLKSVVADAPRVMPPAALA